MFKQILITLLVIIVFIAGGILGLLYQSQKDLPLMGKSMQPATLQPNALTSILSSPIVTLIVASGKVSEIKGNQITISSGDKSVAFTLAKASSIYLGKKDSPDAREKVQFSEIKMEDTLSVNMKLLPSGDFEAYYIVIQAR